MEFFNQAAAFFIARIFLGVLFFIQGYDKAFNVGVKNVVQTFEPPLTTKHLPEFIVTGAGWFTTLVEFIGGLFLILGFLSHYVLYFLGIDLIIVAIGLGIIRPMWDMQFVFPRLVLLIALLVMPGNWNIFSLDYFLFG